MSRRARPSVVAQARYDAAAPHLHARPRPDRRRRRPGKPAKQPVVIPIALGLRRRRRRATCRSTDGRSRRASDGVVVLDAIRRQSSLHRRRRARRCPRCCAASRRRSSSTLDLSEADLLVLLAHDSDPFNRWQAAQTLAMRTARRALLTSIRPGAEPVFDRRLAMRSQPCSSARPIPPSRRRCWRCRARPTSPAKSAATSIPTRSMPRARRCARRSAGGRERLLARSTQRLDSTAPYSPDAAGAGRRALRNAALDLLAARRSSDGRAARRRRSSTRPTT